MDEQIKAINELIEKDEGMKPHTILTIKRKPKLTVTEDETGLELNDGYDFEVDAAVPEIADGIAKFAKELPNNGFGKDSDRYFIHLICEYFNKLNEQ